MPTPPPPPRRVPASVGINVLLRGTLMQLAWLGVLVGFGVGWIFFLRSEAATWAEFRGPTRTSDGLVTDVRAQQTDRRMLAVVRYRYTVGELELNGLSYARYDANRLQPGDAVKVEHLVARPEVSRVAGLARRPSGADSLLFLMLPLAALGAALVKLTARVQVLRLLRSGAATLATVEASEGRRAVKFSFPDPRQTGPGYRDEPTRVSVTTETEEAETLVGERDHVAFVDPVRPERAVLLDAVPGLLTLDASGRLTAATSPVTPLVLPLLCLFVHGTIAYHVVARLLP
ncbi:MAG: hypothetical protein KF718_04890 [Polyangiaceae bacterium]|nr:hypothetical protein [Polyangiaceae bacterium]